jgi:hypothetical protein
MFEPTGSNFMYEAGAQVSVLLSRTEKHMHCEELIGTAAYMTI